MTLSELIDKLQGLEQQGWGNLYVAVLIEDKTYAPQHRGAIVKDANMGDIGGWGNYTIYLEPFEALKSVENEKK